MPRAPHCFPRSPPGHPSRATRTSSTGLFTSGKSQSNYNDLTLEGQASWEPDFWGRVRRTVEAARDNAQASAADIANVNLTLQADMAADYFQLRGLDSEIKLLRTPSPISKSQLDLTQRRLTGGVGTEADVAQAQNAARNRPCPAHRPGRGARPV